MTPTDSDAALTVAAPQDIAIGNDIAIDPARTEEMLDLFGVEGFRELLDMFAEETAAVVARLDASGEAVGLAEDLHFLKGSAANLGLLRLATLCAGAEDALRSGRCDRALLARITEGFAAVPASVRRVLPASGRKPV